MTLQEAKEVSRWWNQNYLKYKNEEMPERVSKALSILDGGRTAASAAIKVLNNVPPTAQVADFTAENTEPAPTGGLAEWVAEVEASAAAPQKSAKQVVAPKRILYGTDDEFTPVLALLSEERKTASPERIKAIDAEKQSIYSKRTFRKSKNQNSTAGKSTALIKPKASQKPVNLVFDKPAKPSQSPKIIQSEPAEIPPTPAPTPLPVKDEPAIPPTQRIELIDFIQEYNLCYCLGNVVQLITSETLENLHKAQWYQERKIQSLKNKNS